MDSHGRCCNPFNETGHRGKAKGLRTVLPWMMQVVPTLQSTQKVCANCRKKLSLSRRDKEDTGEESPEDDTASDVSMKSLNESLLCLGESPIKRYRLRSRKYSKEKLRKVEAALKEKVFKVGRNEVAEAEGEMLQQVKDLFISTPFRSKKVQALTALPLSWSSAKIADEFGVSLYMAKQAKKLAIEEGILSSPNPKKGKALPAEVVETVVQFYSSDEVSRILPGKKDFVSVKMDNVRTQLQKRLVLNNLNELYASFKENYPTLKIGFSKFASLRPKNCVLAGSSGTHAVCVCLIHQNLKLMLEGINLPSLTKGFRISIFGYRDCLSLVTCTPQKEECCFGTCQQCPGIENLGGILEEVFEYNSIDELRYKQWITTDRAELETLIKSPDSFIENLTQKLPAYFQHSFISKEQNQFLKRLKEDLSEGEAIVVADFSENYSFIIQDATQAYHWNKQQATVHPFGIYFKENAANPTETDNFIVISSCMKHDTTAFHCFQRRLVDHIKKKISNLKRLFYFSDGSPVQYKNKKNFVNLLFHEEDFGVKAEWHFFATSHGKNICDGLGGTLKRLAAKASLQRPYENQITNPEELYNWAKTNLQKLTVDYVEAELYDKEEALLRNRYLSASPISGTQKFHAFLPCENGKLQVKLYSAANTFNEFVVYRNLN